MRRVIVIGAGRRVLEDVLPVLARLEDRFELAGVFARSSRTVRAGGREHPVRELASLSADELASCDLVYAAVAKPAVPAVLRRLVAYDTSGLDLMLDTPVLLFRHLAHARHLRAFRNAWVSEDCTTLPWFDAVGLAVDQGLVGELREVCLDRSAWHYHGFAMMKRLLGSARLVSAARRPDPAAGPGRVRVEARFANGRRGVMLEPRDYAVGVFSLAGDGGRIGETEPDEARRLQPVLARDVCTGFRVGDHVSTLDEHEQALLGPMRAGESVTSRMEDMKRVGLYRLLAAVDAGRGAYSWREGLDDMAVDFWLDKLGRYRATPLNSVRSGLGLRLVAGALRLAGKG